MSKLKIIEAYQVPKGNVSPDIFALPCVSWADKTDDGIVYICHDTDTHYRVEAYPTDWICREKDGWHVLHDEEYQKVRKDAPKEYQPTRGC